MRSGGKPGCPSSSMRQPSRRSAATKSPMGRSCMRATPDSSCSPPSSASAAVSGRIAVPALPRKSRVGDAGARPPSPSISTSSARPSARRTPQPICASACNITRVSSLSSRPRTRVAPSLKAASSSTRLEMLLEPGSRTRPCTARRAGTSRNSVVNMVFAQGPGATPWPEAGSFQSKKGANSGGMKVRFAHFPLGHHAMNSGANQRPCRLRQLAHSSASAAQAAHRGHKRHRAVQTA